jgi:DNA-binding CsgD family transcriptional regulator
MREASIGECTMEERAHSYDHLTPRELQVLDLAAGGFCAKEIARRLEISPKTVDRHVENIRLKLRARNRAHMIQLAFRFGLQDHLDIPFVIAG